VIVCSRCQQTNDSGQRKLASKSDVVTGEEGKGQFPPLHIPNSVFTKYLIEQYTEFRTKTELEKETNTHKANATWHIVA